MGPGPGPLASASVAWCRMGTCKAGLEVLGIGLSMGTSLGRKGTLGELLSVAEDRDGQPRRVAWGAAPGSLPW